MMWVLFGGGSQALEVLPLALLNQQEDDEALGPSVASKEGEVKAPETWTTAGH